MPLLDRQLGPSARYNLYFWQSPQGLSSVVNTQLLPSCRARRSGFPGVYMFSNHRAGGFTPCIAYTAAEVAFESRDTMLSTPIHEEHISPS